MNDMTKKLNKINLFVSFCYHLIMPKMYDHVCGYVLLRYVEVPHQLYKDFSGLVSTSLHMNSNIRFVFLLTKFSLLCIVACC